MTALIIQILLSYLLGSVSGSMVLGKFRHVDIRKSGSGNAGGTNAFRTQGFWFALGVVIIDIGKGAFAAGVIPQLGLFDSSGASTPEVQMLLCGFAAVVGHCYPVWFGFQGGKGAATAVGAMAVVQPLVLLPMLITWLLTLILTGWVGLATMLAALSMIPAFLWLNVSSAMLAFAVVLAAFIIFMHRSNIANMRNGSENRFERIRFVNWFR